ncbi:hypothetical protein BJY01DRAFT_250175 [Aspergillus pseudoustus]|uniref:Arrestin-like N-terminal domain-containing protein n=1 Tax=Aspergillus pseudoustus TaxID=1810923 RepID=A0ABR4JJ49_9EURO
MASKETPKKPLAPLRIMVRGDGPWFSGDVLQGHIQLPTDYHIDDADIRLEGALRSWMFQGDPDVDDPHEETVEQQLLTMRFARCDDDEYIEAADTVCLAASRAIFYFRIPHLLPSPFQSPCPRFLQLPPSMNEGQEFFNAGKDKLYMQPLIVYSIKARVIYHRKGHTRLSTATAEQFVQLLPRSGCQPPCALEDFPEDFRESTTRTVKRSAWARPLGVMEMSAVEPDPVLLQAPPTVLIASCCRILVAFAPAKSDIQARYGNLLKCHVQTNLRIKTYLSTRPMDRVPDRQAMSCDRRICLRSEVLRLQEMDLQMKGWTVGSHRTSDKGPLLPGISHLASSLDIPVTVSGPLTPEFVHRYATRLYALVVRLTLPDFSHSPFELEVPLQVVYTQSSADTLV